MSASVWTAPLPNSSKKDTGLYYYKKGDGRKLTAEQQVDYLASLTEKFPIVTIEDGMGERDWAGWKVLTDRLGDTFNWSVTTCS